MLALSQAAGVGGLILGIYNLWHSRKKPVNDQQRVYRQALLTTLYDLEGSLESFGESMQGGMPDLSAAMPGNITHAMSELDKFASLLISPGRNSIAELSNALMKVIWWWPGTHGGPRTAPTAPRARDKAERIRMHGELQRSIESARRQAATLKGAVIDIDKGKIIPYLKYRR